MTKTKWTKLVSVRIDLEVLEKLEKTLEERKTIGYSYASLSSVINDILAKYYSQN